jgi:hypothetical protein
LADGYQRLGCLVDLKQYRRHHPELEPFAAPLGSYPPTDKGHNPASLKFQSAARRRSPRPIAIERIQSRQNGETGTDRVTKDTICSREKVSSGANFIFTFSDAMG